MSSKTKIVVLHRKEVIYTICFLGFALAMLVLFFVFFGPKKSENTSAAADTHYVPGTYSASIQLGENAFEVQVSVSENRIDAIELVNVSESTAAMYPLMQPSLEALAEQIYTTQSTENLHFEEENKYTSQLLLKAIESALAKAAPEF